MFLATIVASFLITGAVITSCSKETEQLIPTKESAPVSDAPDTTETVALDTVPPEPEVKENDSLAELVSPSQTIVSIMNDKFYINGRPTYEGRSWNGANIEGLLMNSRMVQGIFDDLNAETSKLFVYPDGRKWDANRNTNDFVAAMDDWKAHGLLAFTLNLQGGSPTGYGNDKGWINSAFDEKGELRPAYMDRLERVLNKADELHMIVILGYFYFGQDELLEDETAVIRAVDNITQWIIERNYQNILVEINNECNYDYDHDILGPDRVHELITRVKQAGSVGRNLPVSTSFSGGIAPNSSVISVSDYVLLHGNGLRQPSSMTDLIKETRNTSGYTRKPILVNEDDHYNFDSPDNNLVSAVRSYVSWGFFDYRRQGENFEAGYQSVPVDWSINSERKRSFFTKIKEITGY